MPPVWRIRLVMFLLTLAAIGMGYVYFTQRLTPEEMAAMEQAARPVQPTPAPTPTTPAVNFSQLVAVPYSLDTTEASQEAMLSFISEYKPGFVVLFGESISQDSAAEAIREISNEHLPADEPLIAVDHEGGRVQRLNGSGFTVLPTWKRICGQTDAQQTAELASSAAELKQLGVNIVFGPVVDVAESNLVLRDRVCSGDPEIVSSVALKYVDIFQEQNILPVIKHYPGLGKATQDTHDEFTAVTITEQDVMPFKAVLDRYPSLAVMTAHVGVTNQEKVVPCSLSYSCVNQIYELYPDTTVFTDALEMAGAAYDVKNPDTPKSLPEVTIEAILAGNTVVVFGPEVTKAELEQILTRMKLEYTSSSEFRERIDQSVTKIQKLREAYMQNQDQINE